MAGLEKRAPGTAGVAQNSRRSCHSCNQRKVRCDKCVPCGPCSRQGRACVYPPAGPRIRRTKKAILADMASRLASLERSLPQPYGSPSPASTLSSERTAVPAEVHSPTRQEMDGFIGKESSGQYFNEVLLSRVIDQERDIRSVLLSDSHTSTPRVPELSPFNALGILSAASSTQTPASFHPPRPLALRLWNVFKDNVEGCSCCKVLHHPTDEVKIYSAIDDPSGVPTDTLGLCYSIYYSALIAIDDSDLRTITSSDKQTLLFSFKAGLEQSLAHSDFLDRPTLTGLTALGIYLTALRSHNRGKGIWILNGLAIRVAQSLGLHRDGQYLRVSPFEAEIRRRLWWHLLSRYGRAGEDYGLENTDSLLTRSSVRLPLNVHDTDLHPDMPELPPERQCWTAMTMSLMNAYLAISAQKLTTAADAAAAAAANTPGAAVPTVLEEETRLRDMAAVRQHVDQYTRYCSPVIPQQRMTIQCATFLVRKFDFLTRLQWALLREQLKARPQSSQMGFATDDNLRDAISILHPRLYVDDDKLQQFAWARRAYPQYFIIMYVLWHLCVRPAGPHVEQAWAAIDSAFSNDLLNSHTVGYGTKTAVLVALRAKAMAVRARLQNSAAQAPPEGCPVRDKAVPPAAMPGIEDGVAREAAVLGALHGVDPAGTSTVPEGDGAQGLSEDGLLPGQEGLSFYLLGDMSNDLFDLDVPNLDWSGLYVR